MNHAEFRSLTNRGWNTRNGLSLISHVKDFSDGYVLREVTVGDRTARTVPGIRSWDGTYTTLRIEYRETVLTVESAVENDQQYIFVTPEKVGYRSPALSVEACLLWGKEGTVGKMDGRLYGQFPDGTRIDVYTTSPAGRLDFAHSLSPAVDEALQTLWSEEDGIFENRNLAEDVLSPRISPTNFYALFSD